MGAMDQRTEPWLELAAGLLEVDVADLAGLCRTASFATLGGTSIRAIEFAALMARRHGRAVGVGELLGPRALADVVHAGSPVDERAPAAPRPTAGGRLLRSQQGMLVGEEVHGGTALHLLFSVDIRGRLDPLRLRSTIARVTARHESLRTVFVRAADGALSRHVLDRWEPVVIEQALPAIDGEPVPTVHALLARSGTGLLRPYERPPVVFVLSRIGDERSVLSLLVHHAVVDGWSIGRLWRELAEAYADGATEAWSPAPSVVDLVARESDDHARAAADRRAEALRERPTTVSLPSDLPRPVRQDRAGHRLPFGLSVPAREAVAILSRTAGLTRNMVLLAAWALVVARRTGSPELVLGLVSAGRPTAESLDVIGPCMKVLPLDCRIVDAGTVVDYLSAVSAEVRSAVEAGDAAIEDVVAALGLGGDGARNPLVQVAFAAHDELIPAELAAGELSLTVHEGHCGGTVYDAVLYVQRWGDDPRLALEYATSVLRFDEAAELADALDHTLIELAADPAGELGAVRTITPAQRQRLAAWADGPPVTVHTGLWQLFEAAAERAPDRVAVRDADPARSLTYAQLHRRAAEQSAALAAAGVATGDCVGLTVGRSAHEIVAILGVLRLGAAYTAIEPDVPGPVVVSMLDAAGVRVVLADRSRLTPALDHGRPTVLISDPYADGALAPAPPAAAPAELSRIAYIGFTSGSTGVPKGIRVTHRGVVRLAQDPRYLRRGAVDRFARIAPLAFDASTLEIFAPLLAGGTVEVYPEPYLTPDGLADFLREREVTGLWLTAGLFRLVADYNPAAFRGVRQVLTGGDVVPPAQVARVLTECPQLRVTNGYGPTENTTFTTVHHVDQPAEVDDPLPIGRPIQGTGVAVLDGAGRLLPPGAIGELCTYGDGLALGYAGLEEETDRAFGRFSADVDRLLYRTGDLVRWDSAGRLHFLGRGDHQVKIRGFRIEVDAVARVLREFPGARDVAVAVTGAGSDRHLLAAVVAEPGAGLLDAFRAFAAERLPGHAIPSRWAVVSDLPTTRNGKLDTARLLTRTVDPPASASGSTAASASASVGSQPEDELVRVIGDAWCEVLGHERFGVDARFFDVGGDSLQLLRVAAALRRDLPGHGVQVQDLFAAQTIRTLSARLRVRSPEHG
jgi:amino acid adenylation domain-containing protein